MSDSEIRFTDKRVDESWKETVARDKETKSPQSAPESKKTPKAATAHPAFNGLVTSLAMQALLHMGEIQTPESGQVEVNLDAAKEIIEILVMLKEKTKGNLTAEEERMMTSLLADLQMKFVQHNG